MSTYSIERIKNVLNAIGFPIKHQTDLTAISILAMLDEKPRDGLILGKRRLSEGVRITDIIAFALSDLSREYAQNTRESIRKHSLKYLVDAGIVIVNPDDPSRPINSGNTHYILAEGFSTLVDAYENSKVFEEQKKRFVNEARLQRKQEIEQRAKLAILVQAPNTRQIIELSPGEHNLIEKYIIEELFGMECQIPLLVYLGDTKNKSKYVDFALCDKLNLIVDDHAKLPDVICFDQTTNTVHIFEAVASCGPVDNLRRKELEILFQKCDYPLRMYSVFLSSKMFQKYSTTISPGTRVYILETKQGIDYTTY